MAPPSTNTPDPPRGTPRGALTALTIPLSSSGSSFPAPALAPEGPRSEVANLLIEVLPPSFRDEILLARIAEVVGLMGSGSPDIPELRALRPEWISDRRERSDDDYSVYEKRIEEVEVAGESVNVEADLGTVDTSPAAESAASLDLSEQTQGGGHVAAEAQGPADGAKGKAVIEPADPAEPAAAEVEAAVEASDDDNDDASPTRGAPAPHTQDDLPTPELYPAPIPAYEANFLDFIDTHGPMVDRAFLQLSVPQARALLLSTPLTSPHHPAAHFCVSIALRGLFHLTFVASVLEDALQSARTAVSLLAPPRRIRTMAVMHLAELHMVRWMHTSGIADISAAINLVSHLHSAEAGNQRLQAQTTRFLFQLHSKRYEVLQGAEDLEMCIVFGQEMTASRLTTCPVDGLGLNDLEMAQAHCELGHRLYDHGDVEESIERFRLAMALSAGKDDDSYAHALQLLVPAMEQRNSNELLAVLQKGVEALPVSHPNMPYFRQKINTLSATNRVEELRAVVDSGNRDTEVLAVLTQALYQQFEKWKSIEDLDSCIGAAETVLAATERTEKETYANRCELLASVLGARYRMRGHRADIDRCIETLERGLEAAEGAALLYVQTNLSAALYARHRHGSDAADIDRALQLGQTASDGTARDHPEHAGRLLNLGNTYMGRFRVYGTRADIDTGISTLRRALEASRDKDSSVDRPGLMSNLAMQLLERYKTFGQPSDIAEAAEYAQTSLSRTPGRTQLRLERMLNLASILENRDQDEDIERSVHLTRSALEDIPKGHRIIPGTMIKLAICEVNLCSKGEKLEGFNAAIELIEQAEAAAKVGHPDRAHVLSSVAMIYRLRYERTGNVKDLERAVKSSYASVTSSEDLTAGKGEYLSMLSELLGIRHRRIGAMEDLELAIKTAREALDCTPLEHKSRPQRIIEICERLLERYKACREEADLFSAITLGDVSLKATPREGENICRRLCVLAEALHLRHCDCGIIPSDLERAITLAEDAWELFKTGNRSGIKATEIAHLIGRLLRTKYCRDGDMPAIDSAINCLEQVATHIDDEHMDRAEVLDSLAHCYLTRYEALGRTGPDGDRSFVTFRDAWECLAAAPLTRIRAATRIGDALARSKRWDEAADILEECVKLMPRVTPPSLARTDQEAFIKLLSPVPLVAANAALEAGRGAERALRLLELGRGIIRGFTMDCRSDISDLQDAHPELYKEFDALRRELDHAFRAPQEREELPERLAYVSEGGLLARRKEALEELEEALAKIRALEGYKNFLLPPTGEELRRMAAEGPIVVFNSGIENCHAILVTTESIRSVQLAGWHKEEAEKHIWDLTKLVRGSVPTYPKRNKQVKATMKWLWDVVVGPVLAELGITEAASSGGDGGDGGGVFPQIWWVGSGPLNFAPFHAAGVHTRRSTKNTISRVISSYIPSIKALTYARQRRPALPPAAPPPSILIVKMPTTPDHSDLHSVDQEAADIESLVGAHAATTLTHPTASAVLSQLPSHRAVHFACHGITNAADPSLGALLLRTPDGALDPLTAQMVADTRMNAAQIAYLSACSTAQNTVHELADETIHLAGAFMLAGFINVVATMWESKDNACAAVAAEYYRALFVQGLGSGKAVHTAVVKLRARKPEAVLDWAPFIHTGA
ncbi:CHAT domain-containing protein [Morchella snyderi]|nr:CHAT domain-containing protein [Morchella snyderi]